MKLGEACFTVFDFETTGLYPYSGDMICEIGAVKAEPKNGKIKKFHSLIDPLRPISYGAFCVNGIKDEMVRGKPVIDEVLPDFLDFIKNSVLVAYNAGFDLGFLECALGENKDMLNDYYIIDALSLARRLFSGIDRYNLGSVSQSLGIRIGREHRALSDALMTWKIFEKEIEALKADGITTVEDIAYAGKKKQIFVRTIKDYKVKLIEAAIRQQKKLNITYRSAWNDKITKRTITPKKIQKGYDRSYVVAHCHLKNEERNFRLDCILDAKPHK